MKRFEFPLDPALRWRKAIAEMRKAEATRCAKAVADSEAEVRRLAAERAETSRQIATQTDASAIAAYAGYIDRSRRNIAQGLLRVQKARAALQTARAALVEADRNARLIEKLRDERLAEWKAEADREIEEFAAESFLNRR